MKSESENSGVGEKGDDWPSVEEFARWLAEAPANLEAFGQVVERAARGDYGDLPPEMRTAVNAAVVTRRKQRSLRAVAGQLRALLEIMQRPPGSMLAEDRLAQCQALMDEITDTLLETPEPHRTEFLKRLVPLREQVRAIRV